MPIQIQIFEKEDADEIVSLIHRSMFETNIADYSEEDLMEDAKKFTTDTIIERASWTNFYVFKDSDKIIATGAIGPYWDSTVESSFFTIFVLPEYQGKGVGALIIKTLENDEFYKRAERIEIPASITAVPFYQKYGYSFKNGIDSPDDEGIVRMEKHKNRMIESGN
ncbi:GNAT family N-acetyltransferase [Macrococcus brunensis]|uniref:GNAT family N-acetyltransferase n=1 Tax=Macrococcus brunensis TaxID=198483 RepID=UPI001EF0A5AA|nr:GNAT family N-acetyltransferase [Macrococcus brunensis]ULG74455.1 GNAT family N-acetyltransferase [Macrococcus brunensis]